MSTQPAGAVMTAGREPSPSFCVYPSDGFVLTLDGEREAPHGERDVFELFRDLATSRSIGGAFATSVRCGPISTLGRLFDDEGEEA